MEAYSYVHNISEPVILTPKVISNTNLYKMLMQTWFYLQPLRSPLQFRCVEMKVNETLNQMNLSLICIL